MHEVSMLYSCTDIEHCALELYVSDVRILQAEMTVVRVGEYVLAAIIGAAFAIGLSAAVVAAWAVWFRRR